MEIVFLSKVDLSTLCPLCIVEKKPDHDSLIVFAKLV